MPPKSPCKSNHFTQVQPNGLNCAACRCMASTPLWASILFLELQCVCAAPNFRLLSTTRAATCPPHGLTTRCLCRTTHGDGTCDSWGWTHHCVGVSSDDNHTICAVLSLRPTSQRCNTAMLQTVSLATSLILPHTTIIVHAG